MAFQVAYYGLYGRIECKYEPVVTKAFLRGRTEAICTVQPPSVEFVKTFFSEAPPSAKIKALRKACEHYVKLTKECVQSKDQDRHLYQRRTHPARDLHPGWSLLNMSIFLTSDCGTLTHSSIIKEDDLSVCASSKHLQTRRFLYALQGYLQYVQRVLVQLHRAANDRPVPSVGHSRTGLLINGVTSDDEDEDAADTLPECSWSVLVVRG
ncbi:CoA-dependent acyltransferase [Dentipellis sp. KUC8613]|nr:CoA-dependent acyltransferase [Dentipellis sp. KUC8613]